MYQSVCVGQCPTSVSTLDEADLSPQVTQVHVLVTQDSTDTQTACLESVEPLLATPDTSDVIKQTRFMFVMDGAQLRLLQEDEDPLVVSDTPTPFCMVSDTPRPPCGQLYPLDPLVVSGTP